MPTSASLRYPQPGPTGGRLIREVIALLRSNGIQLPITSHILIAASAGVDSTALVHVLVKYGRRVGARDRLKLLHVNHGWRGSESDGDQAFVKKLAKDLKIKCKTIRPPKLKTGGRSWEDVARQQRKKIFASECKRSGGIILTAHHADDLAETVLWRILTGNARTHLAGIRVKQGVEVRPFLRVRKADLKAYLEEEEQTWRDDRTNHEGRFLRSQMRLMLMPVIERLFSKAVSNLVDLALDTQKTIPIKEKTLEPPQVLLRVAALMGGTQFRGRRAHWEQLQKKLARGSKGAADWELHLPAGWKLLYQQKSRRWILEDCSKVECSKKDEA